MKNRTFPWHYVSSALAIVLLLGFLVLLLKHRARGNEAVQRVIEQGRQAEAAQQVAQPTYTNATDFILSLAQNPWDAPIGKTVTLQGDYNFVVQPGTLQMPGVPANAFIVNISMMQCVTNEQSARKAAAKVRDVVFSGTLYQPPNSAQSYYIYPCNVQ